MTKRLFLIIIIINMFITSAGLSANVERADAAKNNGKKPDNQVTLNLQDVDIRVLINTVAEVSGKNFVVDPRVKGKVSVISGAALSGDQLYDVFLSILEVHNFSAVDSGNLVKILPSNVIKQRPTPTMFDATEQNNDAQITQILQLKHASVQDLIPIIRPLVPPTSHFAAHTPSNTIILTDTTANIQRLLKIVKRIDVPDKRTNVRVVYLKKADAAELATTLNQVTSNLLASEPGGSAANPANKVLIQPHASINALVINATDSDFERIQALIDELDVERQVDGDVHVLYLKYAKASDLVTILNDVTRSTSGDAQGGSDFSVQADEATNSLIVHADDSEFQTVKSVISKLDVRRAQVYVETVIAEVSINKQADLGIEFGADASLADRDEPLVEIGTATIGTDFSDQTGGLTYNLLDFDRFNLDVLVRALREDTNSNILSTPTILTLDNESAEIVVGQEVPFVTGSFTTNTGTTTTTTNTTTPNTSTTSGITNPFQTIERKDVGIKLSITPQINDGDTIQLEVAQEISSVSRTTVAGAADLITDQRSIEAVVQVDDGQVVVLGGLIRDDIVDTFEWVPILGKIPVVGTLFRRKSKTAVKRNLMVFLKPRIIRSPEELTKFSRERYQQMRDVEMRTKPHRDEILPDLIPEADTPVLEEYDEVTGEGSLSDRDEPKKRGIKRLFRPFWRKEKTE